MKPRPLYWALLFAVLPTLACLAAHWSPEAPARGAEFGRRVYVREGCIHCHSQFVRAGTWDEQEYGAWHDPESLRQQVPALIGNRRQGPDLLNVGLRLSRDWHRIHLMNPRRLVPTSRMPAYDHLFADADPRGEALLDYLMTLGREDTLSAVPAAGPATSNAQSESAIAQAGNPTAAGTVPPRMNAP